MKREIALAVDRYVVTTAGPDGSDGEVVAFARQKRLAMREQVTFYTDHTEKQARFGFKARNIVDLGAGYDVTDAEGRTVGTFEMKFGASLLRSTWVMRQRSLRPVPHGRASPGWARSYGRGWAAGRYAV
ncbi:hypothetical protein [Streptomyces sp. NPDC006134]|uniref:hypothetical protein n=1 Tax=Streptomyces sp. NPDC006134 TaxID=3154467 RepID=UPI0033DFCA29